MAIAYKSKASYETRWQRRVRKPVCGWCYRRDGGFSTLGTAVALLVTLALLASTLQLHWLHQRAQETQVVADAAALAGANVLAKVQTTYTVCDALSLSMGLTGAVTMAASIICAALPGAQGASAELAHMTTQIFHVRSTFNEQANKAFDVINKGMPVVVAMQSMTVIHTYNNQGQEYVGCALPVPLHFSTGTFDTDGFEDEIEAGKNAQASVSRATQELEKCQQQAQDALKAGWMADCGNKPRNLYERTGQLSGLSGAHNPYYATPHNWNFGVALKRAQAYYNVRVQAERPMDDSVDEYTRSVARKAFYQYALNKLNEGRYIEHEDGTVECLLPLLPKNTDEMRQTSLYTDRVWPTTTQDGKVVLHPGPDAPGVKGAIDGAASLEDLELGAVSECPVTHFSIKTLGAMPSPSSHISTGFEYFWNQIAEASQSYKHAKDQEAELSKKSIDEARPGAEAFDEALKKLANKSSLNPADIYKGCISLVFEPNTYQSLSLLGDLGPKVPEISSRGAISAAKLVAYPATDKHNVLAQFFEGLKQRGAVGSSVGSVGDVIFECWGSMLLSYEGGFNTLKSSMSNVVEALGPTGLGGVAVSIMQLFDKSISAAGFAPVDLSSRYPVLCHTSQVMTADENELLARVRSVLGALPPEETYHHPKDIVLAITGVAHEGFDRDEIELTSIELPGSTKPITLSIDIGRIDEVLRKDP